MFIQWKNSIDNRDITVTATSTSQHERDELLRLLYMETRNSRCWFPKERLKKNWTSSMGQATSLDSFDSDVSSRDPSSEEKS